MKSTARLMVFIFVISATLCAFAQTETAKHSNDGITPPDMVSGSPGSINLFNGRLNFALPLINLPGRGSVGIAWLLRIENQWRLENSVICSGSLPGCENRIYRYRPEYSGSARTDGWNSIGYGPGRMIGRNYGSFSGGACPNTPGATGTTRLSLQLADGGEIEFIDDVYNGEPRPVGCFGSINRGANWHSINGESATFISNSPIIGNALTQTLYLLSGTVILRNGTKYEIVDGKIMSIRDRNGNKVTYAYDDSRRVTSVRDSLNREVSFSYGNPDKITFKGSGGAVRAIEIGKASLSDALHTGYSIQTLDQLFPGTTDTRTNNPEIISYVKLPNNQTYQLYYNSHAELAKVVLPTGGYVEWQWSGVVDDVIGGDHQKEIVRRVFKERAFSDGVLQKESTFTYQQLSFERRTEAQIRDGAGNLASKEIHYFHSRNHYPTSPSDLPDFREGKEYLTEYFSDSANKSRSIYKNWANRAHYSWWDPGRGEEPAYDPIVTYTTTTLHDISPNLVSKAEFTYDGYNNVVEQREYDYGADAPGLLLRRTQTTYLTNNLNQGNVNYATDLNIHIRNLPKEVSVFDGANVEVSRVWNEYDDYSSYSLQDCPGIVQHDGGYHTGYERRGNLTKVIQFATINPQPQNIYFRYKYDIAGNTVKMIDGRGVAVDIEFNDRFGYQDNDARLNAGAPELGGGLSYAFPTKVTNTLGHAVYTQYDYYLGRQVNTEDSNEVVSSVAYDDALDRPTQSIKARFVVGIGEPAERRQTTITYDDAGRVVTMSSDRDTFNDNKLTGKSYYDGFGRTWRSASDEGSTWTITDKQFDALGRVSQVSNPYRAADPGSASPPSGGWTKTVYDLLGRVVDVETPDGSHIFTQYSGNQMTAIDQAGKTRRSETDPLGRLIRVTEAPGVLNYVTTYLYDPMNNLRHVQQGQQERWFSYDALSRMIRVRNPEQNCNPNLPPHTDPFTGGNCWSTAFKYDENGNLIEKTDARGVETTITYDAINRPVSRVYAGLTEEGRAAANATLPVNYFYDDYSSLPSGPPRWPGAPSKGRVIGVTYGAGSDGTYYKYNAAGGIEINHQRQGTANYATTYTYNLAGGVTREQRGNYFRNSWTYDDAGRLSGMDASFTPFSSSVNLAKDISYAPSGGLQSETYGNGLIHSIGYNNRLQPIEIRLGRSDNLESVFRIGYIYGAAQNVNGQDGEITPTKNNGNIARIKYFINGALQYAQTHQYDPLNRLSYAVEHNNGVYNDESRAWYQTFNYDPYGNCGIDVANTSDNLQEANSALSLADFSATNNRITRAGYEYDSNGNLIAEPGKSNFYDGENRIVTTTVAGGGVSQNFYDGMGQRVRKVVGGVATRFVYGAEGELIEERKDSNSEVIKVYCYMGGELVATTKNGVAFEYATADHLGTPRAWTGQDGALIIGGVHDYTPFGLELFAGVGTRTTDRGYAANAQTDGQRNQFDGAVRDIDTGLDLMGARYYSSAQGRFTSPDPLLASGRPINPQSWNRYSFVLNRPLSLVDPSGLFSVEPQDKKPLDPPAPPKEVIENAISNIIIAYVGGPGDISIYSYETTPEMREVLREYYVNEYQNTYTEKSEGLIAEKLGDTTPQSKTDTTSASTTEKAPVLKGEVGATISKDGPSISPKIGVDIPLKPETTAGSQSATTSAFRPSSAAQRLQNSLNLETRFMDRFAGNGTRMDVRGPKGYRAKEPLSPATAAAILSSVRDSAKVRAEKAFGRASQLH